MAFCYCEVNDFKNAEIFYLKQIELIKKLTKDPYLQALAFDNLGNCLTKNKIDISKPEKYYLKHSNLKTWNTEFLRMAIQRTLTDEKTRLDYD